MIRITLAALAITLVVGAIGLMSDDRLDFMEEAISDSSDALDDSVPVVPVTVVPLQIERIEKVVTAYGIVEALPEDTQVLTVPYECRVERLFVSLGESIGKEEPLIEIAPSPDALLSLDQAHQELAAASEQLKLDQEQFRLKLGTLPNVIRSRQAVAGAELRVKSLVDRGLGETKTLRAGQDGIVSRIEVQQGGIVPPGSALMGVIGEKDITVRLGIEMNEARGLTPGQVVRIDPIHGTEESVVGNIRMISRELDPETRLVNVFVRPATGSCLFLNEYVVGKIEIEHRDGIVAPTKAILPKNEGGRLFTVEDGHAVEHQVTLGIRTANSTELVGSGLQEGQPVVVLGASQLVDGAPVRVEPDR